MRHRRTLKKLVPRCAETWGSFPMARLDLAVALEFHAVSSVHLWPEIPGMNGQSVRVSLAVQENLIEPFRILPGTSLRSHPLLQEELNQSICIPSHAGSAPQNVCCVFPGHQGTLPNSTKGTTLTTGPRQPSAGHTARRFRPGRWHRPGLKRRSTIWVPSCSLNYGCTRILTFSSLFSTSWRIPFS